MMDKTIIINSLSDIYHKMIKDNDYEQIFNALETIKIHSLVNYLLILNDDYESEDKIILKFVIKILQYIDNNSGLISPISDQDYDKLYALYKIYNNDDIIGSEFNAVNKVTSNHKYPDLRGTLDKIHFLTLKDKGKDNRKSLEEWIKSVENRLGRKLTRPEMKVTLFPKWDGLSAVFECEDNTTKKVLSRGDTQKNEALDWTVMFKDADMSYIFGVNIPNRVYGVKTEVIMSDDNFDKVCKKYTEFKSKRSAVSSILNSELNPDDRVYLTVVPLQYQDYKTKKIDIPYTTYTKYPFYVAYLFDINTIERGIKILKETVSMKYGLDIDGIVIRIEDTNIQNALGRENNINKYEVAYKFPPEQKITKIKDVEFQVGLLGNITPVAKIDPVKIKGNKIKSISLGSIDRFQNLHLRKNDDVIIKYDVIPYLESTGEHNLDEEEFKTPVDCPYCGEHLKMDPVLKCVNLECKSRIKGKILNYIKRLRISNISTETVSILFKEGILTSIEDLYSLEDHKKEILKLDGFGDISFNNIIKGISSKKEIYDYELLGSLGIPSIGERIFKKISNIYYLDDIIDICKQKKVNKFTNIGGIADKVAQKIINGINLNMDLIKFLRSILKVRRDEREYNIKVCFTKVRNKDFEEYLNNKNIMILDKYSKNVDLLIVPDEKVDSNKIDKAKSDGKDIMKISDAYKTFGYNK